MKKIFRIVSVLEGASYLLLLFIATPIKYWGDNDAFVKLLGMPHGILFMAYMFLAFYLKGQMEWKAKTFLIILAASVLPFGTFYIDKKYLRA